MHFELEVCPLEISCKHIFLNTFTPSTAVKMNNIYVIMNAISMGKYAGGGIGLFVLVAINVSMGEDEEIKLIYYFGVTDGKSTSQVLFLCALVRKINFWGNLVWKNLKIL